MQTFPFVGQAFPLAIDIPIEILSPSESCSHGSMSRVFVLVVPLFSRLTETRLQLNVQTFPSVGQAFLLAVDIFIEILS